MATREYWIQIENRPWDMMPNGIDRMTGDQKQAQSRLLRCVTADPNGHPVDIRDPIEVEMYAPVEALLLRRYQPPTTPDQSDAWTVPDDRRVNPWDLNEPHPSKSMGTIPGPIIECNVGDNVVVHFRNMDMRTDETGRLIPHTTRAHSLHPHGIAFEARYGGGFPMSPLDQDQPVPEEEINYCIGFGKKYFKGDDGLLYKRGDRVPAGGTFTYRWSTRGWDSTAGVWLYHDHSVRDHHNVLMGAIGMIVIHDPNDPNDVFIDIDLDREEALRDLPNGSLNGFSVLDGKYLPPPSRALYLQLYHELEGGGMAINGRKYLGNTPTLIGGPETLMMFGLAAMNNETFHTFHLHGHRWMRQPLRTGPGGGPVSEWGGDFEDTRIFGPAESFRFSVRQGDETGASPDGRGKGEWHMHCHVLKHMMNGMMGSLLVVEGGDEAVELEVGIAPAKSRAAHESSQIERKRFAVSSLSGEASIVDETATKRTVRLDTADLKGKIELETPTIQVANMRFCPSEIEVESGLDVVFRFRDPGHTVTTVDADLTDPDGKIEIHGVGGPENGMPAGEARVVAINGRPGTTIRYRCGIHPNMQGTIKIV